LNCVAREIIIYSTKEGRTPFSEWINSLGKEYAARVSKRLLRVLSGNWGDYKSLGEGLFEFRFHEGMRVYFSPVGDKIILLLCGGGKNTKKDQNRDIEKAGKYLSDYWERENERQISNIQ
jgi:putative addiction module killer protein